MKALHGIAVWPAVALALGGALTCTVGAQQPAPPRPAPAVNAATSSDSDAAEIDSKTHQAAIRFVTALGLKERMTASVDGILDQGIASMKAQFPNIRPEFQEEWRRRMKARMNPEDFVLIVAQVYEKYFTAEELDQLSAAVAESKEGNTPVLPDALKEKYQKNAIAMQSEILGGTTQLGAKLGGEVGQEIGKEHPDWAPDSAPKSAPSPK